jgi:hypothetical protein
MMGRREEVSTAFSTRLIKSRHAANASACRFRAKAGVVDISHVKKKPLEGGFSNSNPMIVDQVAINIGFDFRR